MKRFLILITAMVLMGQVYGQLNPYTLNTKKEASLGISSLVILSTEQILQTRIPVLTPSEIALLDPMDVWRFDRGAIWNNSSAAALRSDIAMYSSGILSLAGCAIYPMLTEKEEYGGYFSQASKLSLMWLEVNLLNAAGTNLIKYLAKRPRPYVFNPDTPLSRKQRINARRSFFSGHTSFSSANTFFLAKTFSDYYPDSQLKPLIWSLAVLLPAWTGLERCLAGVHYPTDVIVGYIFGAITGILIPEIHKRMTLKY